jgi:hypothetical protein
MAEFPPQMDVVDEATTRQVAEIYRKGMVDGAHQAEILAKKFGSAIVPTMRKWNVDSPTNRFGFGSTAKKVEKEQAAALHEVAEHLKSAAYFIDAWRLIVDGKFWTPVRMAEAQFKDDGSDPKILV